MQYQPVCTRRPLPLALLLASIMAGTQQARAQLEEIIVTAQFREQSLIDVPVSIATLSGERLSAIFEGGADIRGLSVRVPGLYAESSNGRAAPRFYIRGLGNIDFDLAASQPVSVIMDDVVKENVVLKSFPLFDLDRVEVLRGPQGSLFGRNTTAGIIKFDSRKPTQEPGGYAKLDYGTRGTLNVEGAVGGGLSETLAGRVSVFMQSRDNWIDNGFTGENNVMGDFDERAIRGQLLWSPSETVDALLNVRYRDLEGTSSLFRANIFSTGSNALNDNYVRNTVFFDEGENNPQAYENFGASLRVDWDLGSVTLTSITGYEAADGSSRGDIDGGFGASFLPFMGPGFIPFPAQSEDSADVDQFTQEIRLTSTTDGPLSWQVGAFYYQSDLDIVTNPFFIPPTLVQHENKSWALFGQADFALSSQWTLTVGLRYTDDDKDLRTPTGTIGASDSQLSGNLTLAFSPDDVSTYWIMAARGFRAPTIQGRDVAFGAPPSVADSEVIDSIELGYKAELLDGSLRLNTALFYYQVDDIQFSALGGVTNSIQLINADKGTGRGYELDLEWQINDHFGLTFGTAYADTEIRDRNLLVATCGSGTCTPLNRTQVVNGINVANVDGNAFPNAPRTTYSTTGRFSYPLGNSGEVFAFADYARQGKTQIFLYRAAEFRTNNQWELGLRAGWRKLDGSLEIALFGRNVTQQDNIVGAVDFNNLTGFVADPRIWGLSLSTAF